jgi:hypothetical protein
MMSFIKGDGFDVLSRVHVTQAEISVFQTLLFTIPRPVAHFLRLRVNELQSARRTWRGAAAAAQPGAPAGHRSGGGVNDEAARNHPLLQGPDRHAGRDLACTTATRRSRSLSMHYHSTLGRTGQSTFSTSVPGTVLAVFGCSSTTVTESSLCGASSSHLEIAEYSRLLPQSLFPALACRHADERTGTCFIACGTTMRIFPTQNLAIGWLASLCVGFWFRFLVRQKAQSPGILRN